MPNEDYRQTGLAIQVPFLKKWLSVVVYVLYKGERVSEPFCTFTMFIFAFQQLSYIIYMCMNKMALLCLQVVSQNIP